MKKMGGYLSKGIPGGAQLRERIHAARSCDELLCVVEEFFRPENLAGCAGDPPEDSDSEQEEFSEFSCRHSS